jgi:hypothetical protein
MASTNAGRSTFFRLVIGTVLVGMLFLPLLQDAGAFNCRLV